jgi:hypothetical protein
LLALMSLLFVGWIGPRCTCAHEAPAPAPGPPARAHACCIPRVPGAAGGPAASSPAPAPAHDPDCSHCQATDGPAAALKPQGPLDSTDPGSSRRDAIASPAPFRAGPAPTPDAAPPRAAPGFLPHSPSPAALRPLRI